MFTIVFETLETVVAIDCIVSFKVSRKDRRSVAIHSDGKATVISDHEGFAGTYIIYRDGQLFRSLVEE